MAEGAFEAAIACASRPVKLTCISRHAVEGGRWTSTWRGGGLRAAIRGRRACASCYTRGATVMRKLAFLSKFAALGCAVELAYSSRGLGHDEGDGKERWAQKQRSIGEIRSGWGMFDGSSACSLALKSTVKRTGCDTAAHRNRLQRTFITLRTLAHTRNSFFRVKTSRREESCK